MTTYATESGVAITDVRVSNFRSLTNIEVELGDLTVLIGANNAGKTSFLDALSISFYFAKLKRVLENSIFIMMARSH